MKKTIYLLLLLATSFICVSCAKHDPPLGETLVVDPNEYLSTNQYVSETREHLLNEGTFHRSFMPKNVQNNTVLQYVYWYNCAFFGDPNYAISVTIHYPNEEAFYAEYERLASLDGFLFFNDNGSSIFLVQRDSIACLKDYFEPPVLDGRIVSFEFAILSLPEQTITYSEGQLYEGQKCTEGILNQIQLLNNTIDNSTKEMGA